MGLGTLRTIGSRYDYPAAFTTLHEKCWALDAYPGDLLELVDGRPSGKKETIFTKRNEYGMWCLGRPIGTRQQEAS